MPPQNLTAKKKKSQLSLKSNVAQLSLIKAKHSVEPLYLLFLYM